MDMWEPYIRATQARVPDAAKKIVLIASTSWACRQAVNTVRKQEHRELMESGDETLKAAVPLALQPGDVPDGGGTNSTHLSAGVKVGRAWAIKEALRRLCTTSYPASGLKFWKRWYFWAITAAAPMKAAAERSQAHRNI